MFWKIGCMLIYWFIALILIGIALYITKLKKPINFWNDEDHLSQTISNFKSYNKDISKLYIIHSMIYFMAGLIVYYNIVLSGIFVCLTSLIWILFSIFYYKKIIKKYKF